MPVSIKLGRIFGIDIGLHYSWFIIAGLITMSLAAQFSFAGPDWSAFTVWTAAILTAVLFFVSLLLHELSHALVARAGHMSVRAITLFALGGVAQIEDEASSAGLEFRMAIAGPITSLVIGLACLGGAQALGWHLAAGPTGAPARVLPAMLGWLGYINVALAIFNMIPGYPLDGGRVLRAIIWRVSGNARRSTERAARVGQVLAGLLIVLGLFRAVLGGAIGGLWIAFIGWFLMQAAQSSLVHTEILERLSHVRVGDVMSRHPDVIAPDTTLQDVVDRLMRSGARTCLVARDETIVGLLAPGDLRRVQQRDWPDRTVADAMRPIDSVHTVSPETLASDAFEILTREDQPQLPVIDHDHLEGVLTRGDLQRLVHARAEMGA